MPSAWLAVLPKCVWEYALRQLTQDGVEEYGKVKLVAPQ